MDAEDRKRDTRTGADAERGQPTESNDSGLSFQEEPTDLEASADQGGSLGSDPGRTSPSAAFTPGPPARGRSPFLSPASVLMVLVLIVLVVAAIWLL